MKKREQAARERANHKLVEDAFDDFIAAKKAASDNPDGFTATDSKFPTLNEAWVPALLRAVRTFATHASTMGPDEDYATQIGAL
jgi:hypothetical protein